jgi:hypothetical protein
MMVFSLCFGGIAMAFYLRTQVYALSLASVAAQLLYRDCRFEAPPDRPICMDNLKIAIEAAQSVTGFNAQVTLSNYEDFSIYTGSNSYVTPLLIHKTAEPVTINGESYSSRYNQTSMINPSFTYLYQHYNQNGMVWIVEVYVENPFKFRGIGSGVGYEIAIS